MTDATQQQPSSGASLPPDDPQRKLSVVDPDGPHVGHVSVVGDTYTILLTGKDTAGRYCLIDMHVPFCGGPGPHRHDFEEMFVLLEGEIEFTFRGEKTIVKAGTTINIPANAPHFFGNVSGQTARMLCMCTPAGIEEFFMAIGKTVDSRTATPPKLSQEEQEQFIEKAQTLAPRCRMELLKP